MWRQGRWHPKRRSPFLCRSDKGDKKTVWIRISQSTALYLEKMARARGISLAEMLRLALDIPGAPPEYLTTGPLSAKHTGKQGILYPRTRQKRKRAPAGTPSRYRIRPNSRDSRCTRSRPPTGTRPQNGSPGRLCRENPGK